MNNNKYHFFTKKSSIIIWLFLWLLVILSFIYFDILKILPDLNHNKIHTPKNKIYRSQDKLPSALADKIINIEDKRFYWNILGFDIFRIFKSIYNNTYIDKIQWWSTIDQQLVKILNKNYTNRSLLVKIKETFVAFGMNLKYSKSKILYEYINNIPMTNNIIGLRSACSIYFAKDCDYLSDSEQYFIIATYQLWISPYNNIYFDKIKNRSKFLCENFWWSWCQDIYSNSPKSYSNLSKYINDINPSVTTYLKSQNISYMGDGKAIFWDQYIYDNIQNSINILKPHLSNNGVSDCCVIVLDSDWNLISMNICRNQNDNTPWSDINICLSKRQTGSAIKPFLYMLWFDQLNIDADSKIIDEPVSYFLENNNEYQPKNFDLKYHWEVTIAQALWNSLNIPAVKILHDIWLVNFQNRVLDLRNIYHPIGQSINNIYSDHQDQIKNDLWLSMALWTYAFSPIEFTNLWRVFVNQNKKYISMITKSYHQNYKIDSVTQIYNILSDNTNRYISFGINNRLSLSWWASKSGTSRNFVDGWTCWANHNINRVVCVRVGNHDNRPASASSSQTASLLRNLVAKNIT